MKSIVPVLAIAAALFLPAGRDDAAAYETGIASRPIAAQTVRAELHALVRLEPAIPGPQKHATIAQAAGVTEKTVLEIEAQGFSKVTGLTRRGDNYVFQALDPYGDRVRVVMNARTGEIVGFSRILPRKK